MAEGLNKVFLFGNLGADPDLKTTQGGQAVLKLRLATTESYLDRNNARQERTEWHSVTVWGRRGEALAKFLGKGDRIFVEGRIQNSSYEVNGEKRYRSEIVATNVILGGGRPRGEARDPDMAGTAPSRRGLPAAAPRDDAGGAAPPAAAPAAHEGYDDYGPGNDDIPF